jgi:hypothetical protein
MDTTIIGLLAVILVGTLLFFVVHRAERVSASPAEIAWFVTPEDDDRIETQPLIRDHSFMQRVADRIEATTQCQTVRDGDLIRVYRKNKLVGIVMCCEIGRNATPAMVRTVVELAEHLRVHIMYLATTGPTPADTQKFATLQKVKLISL